MKTIDGRPLWDFRARMTCDGDGGDDGGSSGSGDGMGGEGTGSGAVGPGAGGQGGVGGGGTGNNSDDVGSSTFGGNTDGSAIGGGNSVTAAAAATAPAAAPAVAAAPPAVAVATPAVAPAVNLANAPAKGAAPAMGLMSTFGFGIPGMNTTAAPPASVGFGAIGSPGFGGFSSAIGAPMTSATNAVTSANPGTIGATSMGLGGGGMGTATVGQQSGIGQSVGPGSVSVNSAPASSPMHDSAMFSNEPMNFSAPDMQGYGFADAIDGLGVTNVTTTSEPGPNSSVSSFGSFGTTGTGTGNVANAAGQIGAIGNDPFGGNFGMGTPQATSGITSIGTAPGQGAFGLTGPVGNVAPAFSLAQTGQTNAQQVASAAPAMTTQQANAATGITAPTGQNFANVPTPPPAPADLRGGGVFANVPTPPAVPADLRGVTYADVPLPPSIPAELRGMGGAVDINLEPQTAKSLPGTATAIDAIFGAIPGVGLINAASGALGFGSIGSLMAANPSDAPHADNALTGDDSSGSSTDSSSSTNTLTSSPTENVKRLEEKYLGLPMWGNPEIARNRPTPYQRFVENRSQYGRSL